MGMFDYVNFEYLCPTCNHVLTEFQTKDLTCDLVTVEILEIDNFYTGCKQCGTWTEFTRYDKNTFERQIEEEHSCTPSTQYIELP